MQIFGINLASGSGSASAGATWMSMAEYLATSGVRVTTVPAAFGEYRPMFKGISGTAYTFPGITFCQESADSISATNGIKYWGQVAAGAPGATGNICTWQINCGPGNIVVPSFYGSSLKQGILYITSQLVTVSQERGTNYSYNQNTGLVSVDAYFSASTSTSVRGVGFAVLGFTLLQYATLGFFDLFYYKQL